MGKNLRTFEEYKYFKARKTVEDPLIHWRDNPNVKDPDEPFFNKHKKKYRYQKNQSETLSKFNLTLEEWNKFINDLREIGFYIWRGSLSPKYQKGVYDIDIYHTDLVLRDFSYDGSININSEGRRYEIICIDESKTITIINNPPYLEKIKKVFKYDHKPDLNEIYGYLYNIMLKHKEKWAEHWKKEGDLNKKEKEEEIKYLTSDDDIESPVYNKHILDTSTFDNYKYRRKR